MKKIVISFTLAILALFTPYQTIKSQSKQSTSKIDLIINLTKFIDWSGNAVFLNSKQQLYVLADNNLLINYEVGQSNKTFHNNWQIVCTSKVEDFEEGSVVFITKEKHNYIEDIIRLSAEKNILTITEEHKSFCSDGGMINIADKAKGHKFEINNKIIQEKSLNISSKVLALAKIYDE